MAANENIIEVGIKANSAELDTGLNQAQNAINQSMANISGNMQPLQFRFDMSSLQAGIAQVGRTVNAGISNIRTPTVEINFNGQELQSQAQQASDAISDSLQTAREEASQTTEEVEQLGDAVASTGEQGAASVNLLADAFAGLQNYIASALGAISAGGMVALAKNTADAAKEIENAARLANTSTDEMQRQAYAAKTVGMELDKLSDVYKDVNDKVGEYINNGGGELKDFFDTIAPKVGITAQQFQHLSGPQALQLYFNGLQKANLSQAQMTTYLEAIADDATSLIPLLRNGGAEFDKLGVHAEQLGIVMDKEGLAKSKAFGTSVSTLQATISGFGSKLGSEISPALTRMANEITTNIETSESWEGGIAKLVDGFEWFADNLETVIDLSAALAAAGLTRVIAGTTAAILASIKATIQKVYADGQALIAAEAKAAADLQAARALAAQTQQTVLSAQAQVRATAGTSAAVAAQMELATAKIADRNATEALTAAQNRYNAAMNAGRFSSAGLLGVLGGPAGIAVLVGIVAAGYLLMGDNADKAKPKIDGLTGSIKEQVKQLREMTGLQRQSAMIKAEEQIKQGDANAAAAIQSLVNSFKLQGGHRGLGQIQSNFGGNTASAKKAEALASQFENKQIGFEQFIKSVQGLTGVTDTAISSIQKTVSKVDEESRYAAQGRLTKNAYTQLDENKQDAKTNTGTASNGEFDWQTKEREEKQAKVRGILEGSHKADPEVWEEVRQAFVNESNKQLDELRKSNASQAQIQQYQENRTKEGDKMLEDFVAKIATTYNGVADKVEAFEKKAANPGSSTKDELDKEYEGLKEAISKFKVLLAKNDNFSINHNDEAGKNTSFKGKTVIGDLQGRADTAYVAESKQIQLKAETEITLATKQEELKRSMLAIDMAEQRTKHEYDMGLLSNRQLLQAAQDYERQRFELRKKSLEDQLALQKQMDAAAGVTTETKEQRQISTQIVDLSDQNAMSMQGLNLQAEADKIETTFGGLSQRMSSLWDQGLQSMMEGTLTWRNASNAIFSSMTQFFIQKMIQEPLFAMMTGMARRLLIKAGFIKAETAAEATGQALQTGAHTVGEATRTGVTAAGGLARIALKAGEAIKSILMYAWEAMAGAFNAMVAIPYIGPFLAVGAGAAAFALVAGIAGKIKSARGGYDVPAGLNPITQIHEEEMVLPKPYANVIRDMAKGGEAGQQAAGVNPAAVAAGGDTYHFNISAVDARSVKRMFMDNRGAVAEAAKTYGREFKKPRG
jgi:hypothetical protein